MAGHQVDRAGRSSCQDLGKGTCPPPVCIMEMALERIKELSTSPGPFLFHLPLPTQSMAFTPRGYVGSSQPYPGCSMQGWVKGEASKVPGHILRKSIVRARKAPTLCCLKLGMGVENSNGP